MKKLSYKSLYNSALLYLKRYDASEEMVRRVLKRKLLRAEPEDSPENYLPVIEEVIEDLKRLNYVNDARYAENQGRGMALSGKSARFIAQKLIQQGVSKEIIQGVLASSEEMGTEEERALAFIHKKHLVLTRENRQKNLAKLARAGFSYETAMTALEKSSAPE